MLPADLKSEIALVKYNWFYFFIHDTKFSIIVPGIRMLDGNTTDTIEGSALSYHNNYIHIYSCAWGPKDDGKRFGRPGTLASKALELGTKEVISEEWEILHILLVQSD